ncbi:MAG: ACT domain-containing protein [Bacillota bacterium]
MEIEMIPENFTVCKVEDFSEVNFDHKFIFLVKTDEENSLVCPTKIAPKNVILREDNWRAFRVKGVLDFSLVGVLAKIATVLANEDISIYAVSTYNTDYIFVKDEVFEKAVGLVKMI